MSDYSSVAPPQTQQNFSQSSAFAAALQRAKQIAAKIQPAGQQGQGTKRALDDGPEPETKKFSGSDYSSSNSSMSPAAMAVQQAAAVAARLSQSADNTITEDVKIPDKVAALLSGRSGNDDSCARLQNESGCKIQMSRDSDRICNLSGSREAINRAKDLLQQMCQQQNCGAGSIELVSCVVIPPNGSGGYPPYQEVMVPGSKVGLVIGKGGETIKMLQEKTGAKMVIIQDGPGQELVEKPLRISGDPQKVEHAKQLVFDLILDKEAFNNRGFNGGAGGETAEVFVPKVAVGVVIGKGGEMIKKIQNETGCKLQFVQGKNDAPGDRRCIITGTKQQVDDAKRTIEELIESVMRSNQSGGGMNNRNNMNATNSNYGYGSDMSQQPMREEVSFTVPASKCGIVIGRGGETIKLINQQSGAFCEMDRGAINPPSEKMFKMKGTPEQIEHARQLISEKIGVEITILSTRPIGSGGGGGGNQNNYGGMQGNNAANAYQQQQWGYQAQSWDQSQQQQQQQQAIQINPSTGQPDYSAQWIEYYKSMGLTREAEMIEHQIKAKNQSGPQPLMSATTNAPNGSSHLGINSGGQQGQQTQVQQAPQQGGQVQAGGAQPDYSKQWAEYFRSIGKIEDAEAIEGQLKTPKGNAQSMSQAGGVAAVAANSVASVPAGYQAQQAAAQTMAGFNPYAQYYANAAAQPGFAQAAAAYGGYGGYPAQQQMPQQAQPPQANDKN